MNTISPYLAKSWTTSPSTIVFTLRKDATRQDGTPITATVVANSLHRFTDPATKSSQAARLLTPGPYTISADDGDRADRLQPGPGLPDQLGVEHSGEVRTLPRRITAEERDVHAWLGGGCRDELNRDVPVARLEGPTLAA